MKKIQWFAGVVLFGVLFFPLRFLWVMLRRNWEHTLIRFVLVPVSIAFSLWYLHILKDNVFYLFLGLILVAYLITSYYFFSDKKTASN